MVLEQEGFEYQPEKPALPSWVEQKWGWRALEPGARPVPGGGAPAPLAVLLPARLRRMPLPRLLHAVC